MEILAEPVPKSGFARSPNLLRMNVAEGGCAVLDGDVRDIVGDACKNKAAHHGFCLGCTAKITWKGVFQGCPVFDGPHGL